MKKKPAQPNIFEYLDYRRYITDLYTALRKENPRFSKREFARVAGSTSPNFLQFIQERKLYLHDDSLDALADFLKLNRKEKRYFHSLVSFDRAQTHTEKDTAFQAIISSRSFGPLKQLQEDQYTYLRHWYMPVIRELVISRHYTGNPAWIAERIIPPISESKTRKGIALLEKLDLITCDPRSKRYVQTDTVLSTPSEVMSLAVIGYHKSIIGLGKEAVERFGPHERDIRGVTVGISRKTYFSLKKQMESFWRQVMATANEPQDVEKVYHVGFMMFPLSEDVEE